MIKIDSVNLVGSETVKMISAQINPNAVVRNSAAMVDLKTEVPLGFWVITPSAL